MSPFIILSAVFLVAAAQANDNSPLRDQVENEAKISEDQDTFESFGSPVYGTAGLGKSGIPKSGYSVPVPPLPALPAAYSAYLNALGYGSPYGYGTSYNRFGVLPYTAPYYGYGGAYGVSPYNSLGLGYGAALGYGYGAGLPYANPLLGRVASAYNAYGYGGLPYGAGLGYRFGGLGYNAAALRTPVAAGVPAPVAPVPAPLPAGLPAGPAYRPPVLPTQGKDGSLRYGYPPVGGQRLVY